ncbi:GAF domain-containing SpoIIE family protein phosphatase [Streptomyces sp. NPDC017520]|uniref:GAF domain-containing SpoIIE family protein phosphatase n=1 Tax=Streptomyces sp. NPDC017520 TaxID=3364998 RepID=UPI0037B4C28E
MLRRGEAHSCPDDSQPARALVTGRSVLHHVAGAGIPAWMAPSESRREVLRALGLHSVLLVPLHSRGGTLGLVQFVRHRTSAPLDDDDLLLAQEIASRAAVSMTSASCLYAIYDPVSRRCSLASAGHLPPTVVPLSPTNRTSSVAELPEVPIGPPLGLGGLPFETAEFELPEGSLLVLHTDGLLAGRTRDVDVGLATLHDVLTSAPESLEETCDQLLASLLPGRPADDVALLVARTRALDPDQVAVIDLPSDAAAVSGPAASPPTSWRPGDWRNCPSPRSWSQRTGDERDPLRQESGPTTTDPPGDAHL